MDPSIQILNLEDEHTKMAWLDKKNRTLVILISLNLGVWPSFGEIWFPGKSPLFSKSAFWMCFVPVFVFSRNITVYSGPEYFHPIERGGVPQKESVCGISIDFFPKNALIRQKYGVVPAVGGILPPPWSHYHYQMEACSSFSLHAMFDRNA